MNPSSLTNDLSSSNIFHIIDNYSWRLVYATNIPIGILIVIFASFCFPKEDITVKKHSKFPFLSASAFILVVTIIQLACERFSISYSYLIELLIYMSLILIGINIFFEHQQKFNSILNIKIFNNRNFRNGCIGIFLINFCAFGTILVFPIYFQELLGYSAVNTGLILLPGVIAMAIGMGVSGGLSKDKHYELFTLVGTIITLLSLCILSFETIHGNVEQLFWPLILRGFGLGLIFVPLSNISLTRISKNQISDGSAIFNLLRQFGGAIGITFAGQILSIPDDNLFFGFTLGAFKIISLALIFFIPSVLLLLYIIMFKMFNYQQKK